ncbi:MAG: pyridoxal phosphate-dependent aminotransferase, partial [Candidatus Chromulinivorax sp.]|nr:pyridoxal phosphate-dependent aminotransferase [Candidatus Chromulinivorax sp.]
MLTPEGQPANKTDKIMLLAMWTNALRKERSGLTLHNEARKKIISAGMGRPTYPINQYTIQVQLAYWRRIEALVIATISSSEKITESAVIGYGDPRGDVDSREIMASAMSNWYETPIQSHNILFTVGGAGALRVIFETFNFLYENEPKYRVITPFPHYTLYADNQHQLHPIDVMKEPGYRLTARSMRLSIEQSYELAKKDGGYPKVLLLCNPSNPLGTIISEEELKRIAELLRLYPDIHIVLDEAYAEMSFNTLKIPSFLTIAPDLKNRIIIMRSATKALSAAGERMALLIAFDEQLMGKLLDKNISTIGHAPRSSQLAYAETMAQFTSETHQELVNFYLSKVNYVAHRLQEMGASMPDPEYKVDGTFYILGDFSDLFGLELPSETARALEKTGTITTNEEIAYYLLFHDSVMIAPSSYFGLSKNDGFMRITCSGDEEELQELMNRLAARLFEARYNKKISLLNAIAHQLPELREINKAKHDQVMAMLSELS